jgi:SET domain-containing protein
VQRLGPRMKSYPKLEVKAVRNGKGIVASSRISARERICRIDGKIVSSRQVLRYWDRTPQRGANCFRYGPDHYIDPDGEIGQYANHSCAPNAGIIKHGRSLFMIAIQAIRAGDEITHDYSTLLGADDVWTMRCNCGKRGCRGKVANVCTLPGVAVIHYMRRGLIPAYILDTVTGA